MLDVVLKGYHLIDGDELPDWINSVGLIFANLPDVYHEGLTQRLVAAVSSAPLSTWNLPPSISIFNILDFDEIQSVVQGPTVSSTNLAYLLALAHSVYHHCGLPQLQQMPDMVRDRLIPVVRTEEQLIFVYHLVGPFLQRLHAERSMRPLFESTINLYKMLAKVDREVRIKNVDAICDILYHVKYQFTGDTVRHDAERVVRDLRPELQLRLKFIAPGIFIQQQQQQQAQQGAASSSISSNHANAASDSGGGGPVKKARMDLPEN